MTSKNVLTNFIFLINIFKHCFKNNYYEFVIGMFEATRILF